MGKGVNDRFTDGLAGRLADRIAGSVCKGVGWDTECPLQVCQLSRSSESTHVFDLKRDVASLDSARAPDDFWERRGRASVLFPDYPE